jgi:short-subunit dehydrogenase
MIEINLLGAFAWLNPISALFQSAKSGIIVGISSVAGDRGRVGNPGYNTSKAALTTYLEALRNRLTRHGVNVITVKPGFVQTEMLKAAQTVMFPITVDKAADDIWRAIRARKQQIYTPWFWSWIMLVIRNIPSLLFRRMSF